jgi:hypothetical protein
MSTAFATRAVVTVPGVPPAWTNQRGHHMQRHAEMARWKHDTWMLAHSARNAAGWPIPVRCAPPAPRYVRFDLWRCHPLDDDNAWASIKPLLDALAWPGEGLPPGQPGPLLVDDRREWCRVIAVEQHKAQNEAAEHVVITVWPADPR